LSRPSYSVVQSVGTCIGCRRRAPAERDGRPAAGPAAHAGRGGVVAGRKATGARARPAPPR
jgi:hypothetical protein